ncbi:MAG: pyridoxal phosphate-dependent aminotransferase [Candidatus Bathyarchaeota archaeon]
MDGFSAEVRLDLLRRYAQNRWAKLPEDVIPLTAADPDFRAAPAIREAVMRVAEDGVFSYGADGGGPRFKEAAAAFVTKHKGYSCHPDEAHAVSGVAQAMMITARAFLEPGDEAILFDPVDFLFGRSIDVAGGRRVYSVVDRETRSFDLEGLKGLVSPKTKMLCVCNPHNPLGRVLTSDELGAMVDLSVDHDLTIMSDEIWSDIVYDGRKHVATATIPSAAERTVSLYGFSKTYGLAGLQLGYMVAQSPELMERIKAAAPGYFYPVNTLSLAAGTAALEEAWPWVEGFMKHLTKMRDYCYSKLRDMPGVIVHKPEGTYALFPDVSSYRLSSEEMAKYMLEEAKVAVVPGHGEPFSYFGPGGEGHVRLVFCTGKEILAEALDRIETALGRL